MRRVQWVWPEDVAGGRRAITRRRQNAIDLCAYFAYSSIHITGFAASLTFGSNIRVTRVTLLSACGCGSRTLAQWKNVT